MENTATATRFLCMVERDERGRLTLVEYEMNGGLSVALGDMTELVVRSHDDDGAGVAPVAPMLRAYLALGNASCGL